MNPHKQISQDDLILYALQDLSPAEVAEMQESLALSESARAELAQIQADLAAYALTSEMEAPPLQARERFLRQVSKEKKMAPADRPVAVPISSGAEPFLRPRENRVFRIDEDAPARRTGIGVFGWAGWAVAAALAITAGVQYYQHETLKSQFTTQTAQLDKANGEAEHAAKVMQVLTDGGAMQVTLRQTDANKEPPRPIAHAAYAADTGSLVFVAMHLQQLELDKTYELWLIPADGKAPIPAGTFKPNVQGFASIVLPSLPRGIVASQLGVTIENEGGSQTPTMPIVLAGM